MDTVFLTHKTSNDPFSAISVEDNIVPVRDIIKERQTPAPKKQTLVTTPSETVNIVKQITPSREPKVMKPISIAEKINVQSGEDGRPVFSSVVMPVDNTNTLRLKHVTEYHGETIQHVFRDICKKSRKSFTKQELFIRYNNEITGNQSQYQTRTSKKAMVTLADLIPTKKEHLYTILETEKIYDEKIKARIREIY